MARLHALELCGGEGARKHFILSAEWPQNGIPEVSVLPPPVRPGEHSHSYAASQAPAPFLAWGSAAVQDKASQGLQRPPAADSCVQHHSDPDKPLKLFTANETFTAFFNSSVRKGFYGFFNTKQTHFINHMNECVCLSKLLCGTRAVPVNL